MTKATNANMTNWPNVSRQIERWRDGCEMTDGSMNIEKSTLFQGADRRQAGRGGGSTERFLGAPSFLGGLCGRSSEWGRQTMRWTCTLLGVPSCVRFCQQEFGEFPRPVWAVGSYSSGPPAGGTPQNLVDKTSRMTGRLRV